MDTSLSSLTLCDIFEAFKGKRRAGDLSGLNEVEQQVLELKGNGASIATVLSGLYQLEENSDSDFKATGAN